MNLVERRMKKTKIIYLLFIFLAIFTGYFIGSMNYFSFYKPEEKIVKFYELIFPGSKVEIINLKEESGLYKAVLKIVSAETVSYQEAFVTKDGKLLSQAESVIKLDESIKQIENSKNFVDCLFNKGVRIYGILNQSTSPQGAQATFLQLNILGRLYSPKLYVSCDGPSVQNCLDQKISQVPSIAVEGSIEPGIKTIDWFVNKTGCKV